MSHPADGVGEAGFPRTHTHEAEAQVCVEDVLGDEGDERERHGGPQHVENTGHIVHVELTAHHLVLLMMTDPSQPERLQLLHLTYTHGSGIEMILRSFLEVSGLEKTQVNTFVVLQPPAKVP